MSIKINGKQLLFLAGVILAAGLLCFCHMEGNAEANKKELCIVLDPGHGGNQPGAENDYVEEKELNLKIALYLKEELENYRGVRVFLTRETDERMELEERSRFALNKNADAFISIHNNAKGEICDYDNGCTVLTAKGNYLDDDGTKERLAEEGQKLGCNILKELEGIGLVNRGLLFRDSEVGETYGDGTLADYYALIRQGVDDDLLSVIIEHAFMDNHKNYEDYLSNDEKLRKLAKADAAGIARYFCLKHKETGEILPELENYETAVVHIHDGKAENNDILQKLYYKIEDAEEKTTIEIFSEQTESTDNLAPQLTSEKKLEESTAEIKQEKPALIVWMAAAMAVLVTFTIILLCVISRKRNKK